MDESQNMFAPGAGFFTGCNYWASHAGTAMWRDWRPEVVAEDFRLLGENGVEVARVFPLLRQVITISKLSKSVLMLRLSAMIR